MSPLWSDMVFLIEVRFDQKHVHGQERPSESLDRPSSLVAFTSLPCLPRESSANGLAASHPRHTARQDIRKRALDPTSPTIGHLRVRELTIATSQRTSFRDTSTTISRSIKQPCESQFINLLIFFSNTCNHKAASSVETSPTRETEKANTASAVRIPRFGKARNRRN